MRRPRPTAAPEAYGWETLELPDDWWRQRWAQTQSTEALADRCGIPVEDVRERLRGMGLELRGRPPEGQCHLFELPARRASVFTLDCGGAEVETVAMTWREACARVWTTEASGARSRLRVLRRRTL